MPGTLTSVNGRATDLQNGKLLPLSSKVKHSVSHFLRLEHHQAASPKYLEVRLTVWEKVRPLESVIGEGTSYKLAPCLASHWVELGV